MPGRRVRGISPIVAAILLILVAIAGAVIVYLWLTGFAGTATATPATMKARLEVEQAAVKADTGVNAVVSGNTYANKSSVILYVRNVGDTTINITQFAIYVYDHWSGKQVFAYYNGMSAPPNSTFIVSLTPSDGMLAPNVLGEINVTLLTNLTLPFTVGKYYDIKLSVAGIEYYYSGVQATK